MSTFDERVAAIPCICPICGAVTAHELNTYLASVTHKFGSHQTTTPAQLLGFVLACGCSIPAQLFRFCMTMDEQDRLVTWWKDASNPAMDIPDNALRTKVPRGT